MADRQDIPAHQEKPWWQRNETGRKSTCVRPLRVGDGCPACGKGPLTYNGLFQLWCPRCGKTVDGGAFS